MDFGRLMKVEVKGGADSNGRNSLKTYARLNEEGELSGVFQLVTRWKPIGHGVSYDHIK